MNGHLPEGWRIDSVMSVFSVISGKTPSTKMEKYWRDGDIEWITPADMSDINEHVYLKESSRKVSKSALIEAGLNLVPKDTIILSTRAPVGTLALSSTDMTFNQGCHGLINRDPSLYDTRYFYYYLLGKKRELQNQSGGSTFKELSKERLNSFSLLIPPLAEQRRIAGILTTADSAIEDAGKAVFKSHRIKIGLMQRLIPRDTDNMPVGSELVRIGDICTLKSGSYLSDYVEKTDKSVPYVKVSDLNLVQNQMHVHTAELSIMKTVVSQQIFPIGTIIFPKRGGAIGTNKKRITACEIYVDSNIMGVIPGNQILPEYLYYYFQNIDLGKLCNGSTVPQLNNNDIAPLKIILPPLAEQRRIAGILTAADEQIALCQKRKALLQRTKTGLMQNLLSRAAS
ncbi:MAG: restriction endonuclease subunit S [Methanosarcinaceae archaeon]|nr:restriction endonuclease subunit S [Methanosarcinaceae archaeon]